MQKRLVNMALAVRNSRTARVSAIVSAIWIALLVGFVGASWMAGKTNHYATHEPQREPQQFAAPPRSKLRKQQHTPAAASSALPVAVGRSNQPTRCDVPAVTSQQTAEGAFRPFASSARKPM